MQVQVATNEMQVIAQSFVLNMNKYEPLPSEMTVSINRVNDAGFSFTIPTSHNTNNSKHDGDNKWYSAHYSFDCGTRILSISFNGGGWGKCNSNGTIQVMFDTTYQQQQHALQLEAKEKEVQQEKDKQEKLKIAMAPIPKKFEELKLENEKLKQLLQANEAQMSQYK